MRFNFSNLNAKKAISILCAIAILATALPLNALLFNAKAAGVGDIIDFEGANAEDIVAGNDDFSLAGLDKEDKYYFYAKNNTADTLSITFDDIKLDANKKYTLDFDVYTLRVSKMDDNSLLGLKVYGEKEVSLEQTVSNIDICEENWANYHTTFEAKEENNKLEFSLYTFGKVFIDNFVLIDENGKETALDFAKACEKTEHPDHFSASTLYDIAYDEIDVVDGYLKAVVPENSNTIHNEGVDIPFNIGKNIEAGRYTVKLDIKFTAVGSCRNSFCVSVAGMGVDIQQKWIDAVDVTLNKYETFSYDFDLTSEYNYFRFNVYQGCTAYIDNVYLIDAAGTEIVKFDFDSPVNFKGSYFEQKGIPKTKAQSKALYQRLMTLSSEDNYVVAIDNSKGTNFGQLYLHEVGMDYSKTYPAGDYTIKFDFYALEIGSNKNIVAQLTKPDWSGDAFPNGGQKWLEIEEKLNEWQTLSFDITTVADGKFPWFYIGAGLKGYFDNFQIIDKKTGNTLLNFSPVEADLGKTSKEICKVEKLAGKTEEKPAEDNYVVAIDNSKGTNFGQLYLHEVGMDYSKTYPAGDYTIKFDFYALEIGSNKNIVAQLTKPDWSGDAFPNGGQKWLEIEEKLNEWQTLSFDITTVADGKFPWFYIGAGLKGYFDNFQIIDKKTGNTLLNFSPVEADLGKTSKEICKVEKIAGKTEEEPAVENAVLLVDTTTVADNGNDNKNFWFNELGMASYYNKLVSGKKYTITFDVYPEKMPNSNNLFHYRTSNGSASSNAGWWGKDLEVGKWQTTSNTFTVTDASKSGNHILFVYGGFKGYIDNLKLVDENGNTVEGTFTDFSDITVPDKHKDYLKIEIQKSGNKPAVKETVMLVDTTTVADNGNDNKNFWFNELGMASYYNKLVSGEQYTITFDVYPEKMPNSNNLFHYRTSSGSASSNAGWWGKDLEVGKWQTTSNTFTVQDGAKTGNHILYVYGGFKGYIDNLKLVDKNGNTVEGTFTDFSNLTVPDKHKDYLTITEITIGGDEPEEPEHSNDFAIELDNSKGTNYGQFYLHELGMAYDTIYPVGNYTVKFDIYLLEMASNDDIVACLSASGWSGNAFPGNDGQVWLDIADKVGEWQTISFDVTTVKDGQFPNFHLGAGIKAYFDNYQIIDNKTGNTVLNFTPAEADLGKTSKGISKVVELPVDVADRDSGSTPDEPEVPDAPLTSGMKITILRGRAGKNGASIKLGGANSPLTIKSNTSYRLSFKYYQANPTDSGVLNLFGIDAGFDNDIVYFKKNNTTGWANGTVYFTTGEVTNAATDWLEVILNPNAWVYFDDFKIVEQEADNNKAVSVIKFDKADDSIYPSATAEKAEFGYSSEHGGTFKAYNATEYTNDTKNSNRQYTFKGIKLKSNTTYRVSIDYYVEYPFTDYAAAFGFDQGALGVGTGASWPCFINNETVSGWHTKSFTVTTGDVVPNGNYINLAFYDVNDSKEPRVMYFDNLSFTELYKVETSLNDATLGTVTKTKTLEAGESVKVTANAFAGAKFDGWYEYGDLVSTDKYYHIKNIDDNHKLVAKFSGETEPSKTIVQSFEDYDLGDIDFPWYEIVNDSKNVLDGKQSLHVKPDKITDSIEASIFFPVVSNVKYQLKDDYTYDFYVWVKPAKTAKSVAYYAVVNSMSRDLSDMVYSGELSGTGMSANIKPQKADALEEKDGWFKYRIGTITKKNASMDGFAFQICKFHANRAEGASIDDLYIDRVEVVERTPDFANLKYTEKFFNEITNSNFEEKVTEENWAPLTDGVTVEKVTDKEYDWQGKYNLKFDAAKSNGNEYVRIIPISKTNKNYTFAAWTKLSKGSDITVGLYKDGQYKKFKNVVNGKNGTLPLVDDDKWNRVSFTFNTGDSDEAYLVIKGTKGSLYLDMVELFIAERGYVTDPNTYGSANKDFDLFDPIAFPDEVIVDTTIIETIIDEIDDDQIEEIEPEEETPEKKPSKKKYKVVKKRKVGGMSTWGWIGIGAGALVLVAGVTLFIIFFKKRKNKEKEAV